MFCSKVTFVVKRIVRGSLGENDPSGGSKMIVGDSLFKAVDFTFAAADDGDEKLFRAAKRQRTLAAPMYSYRHLHSLHIIRGA